MVCGGRRRVKEIVGDRRNLDMPPVEGVADNEERRTPVQGVPKTFVAGEEDAAVTSVADDAPAAAVGARDETEGEVRGVCAGAGGQRGAARRLDGAESDLTTATILE